ncbi:MAG: HlyD family efflux transporter periplasmic adaptor subunit [Deltaproteobacteria bacterium]|jgi:membrane fusion protein (multidrug efflux system)|nr:HlyD family efflux transporter periplasmic adaptor subunit [Deltaproteobacteria bacterium]
MSENSAKLELPEPGKRKKRGGGRMLALLAGLGLLGCAAAYGAWIYYSIQTPSAVIENTPLVLGAQVPAQVTEVLVKKNDRVLAGQALIRFTARTGASNAAEARAQTASVRALLPPPPDMADVARRVAEAQAAEQDVVNRITQARTQEEEAARDVQRKAEEHARAQLELRRLDLLSTRYAVPRALHDQARSDEYGARQNLEKARATREEHSRTRAATEGEMYRMKTELAEWKKAQGHAAGMPGPAQKSAPVPPHTPSAPASPDVISPDAIVAPMDAVVTDVFAQPGIWAQANQQLIALMPDAGQLEATAWFPEKDGASIQPGQICRVFVMELPGKSFAGKVEHVLPAGSMAPRFPLAAPAQSRQIPVRVRFSANDAGSLAELKSGMRAAVRVHNFAPPWVRQR